MADRVDKGPSFDESRFNGYLELSKMGFERFHLRRNFEWKVNFGFWTAFAVMISFGLAGGDQKASMHLDVALFWTFHILAWLFYIGWNILLHLSNRVDQMMGFAYQKKAEGMVNDDGEALDHTRFAPLLFNIGGFRFWAPVLQMAMTTLLIFCNIVVYCNRLE